MGYKQIEPNMTFAEVSLLKSMEHNRSLKRLEKINQVINWSRANLTVRVPRHWGVSVGSFQSINPESMSL